MKRHNWPVVALAALLLVSLSACGVRGRQDSEPSAAAPSASAAPQAEPDPTQPEGIARLALDAVKELDAESALQYIAYDNTYGVSESEIRRQADELLNGKYQELSQALTQNLSVELGEAEVLADEATVKAKIRNTDLSSLTGKMAVWVLQNGTDDREGAIQELTRLILAADTGKTHTSEVTLHLEQEDGAWRLVPDEALLNAVAGNVLGPLEGAGNLAELFKGRTA